MNECDQGAIERGAARPAFERSDCDAHSSNHAPVDPGSVLGRFSARAGIDNSAISVPFPVCVFVSGLAMFVILVGYLLASWISAVHGFSRRRARWITVAMACGAFAIYANLSTTASSTSSIPCSNSLTPWRSVLLVETLRRRTVFRLARAPPRM